MNEMSFWLITLLILLSSIALFIVPILREKQSNEQTTREALNKAFFHDRMKEIKKEVKDGLVENENEITVELQQSLIDDIPVNSEKSTEKSTITFVKLIPGILLILTVSYGLYSKVGNYNKVVDWQNVVARLPDLSRLLNTGDQLTEQEMLDLILALRTQLSKTPDEAMGWLLLGRLGLANRDVLTAEGAMEKAYRLDPRNTEIQLGYAQAMMLSGDEFKANQARNLLHEIIQQDDTDIQVLSLLAFDAFENRDFASAISFWSKMKEVIANDDPRQEMLSRSIDRAQALLQPSNNATSNNATGSDATSNSAISNSTANNNVTSNDLTSSSNKGVKLKLSLDEKVILPTDGMLVISVHDQHNSPVPVAAKLLPLSSFPLDVEITDADSMIKARLLSSLTTVIVRARIDTDGNIMTKQGDWGAETSPFNLGESKNIIINQKLE